MMVPVRKGLVLVSLVLGAALSLSGCGDDDPAVECCMLTKLAENCDDPNSTTSLKESVQDWRDVGSSGDADACKAMINAEDNGCSGSRENYDEQDAVVACN